MVLRVGFCHLAEYIAFMAANFHKDLAVATIGTDPSFSQLALSSDQIAQVTSVLASLVATKGLMSLLTGSRIFNGLIDSWHFDLVLVKMSNRG